MDTWQAHKEYMKQRDARKGSSHKKLFFIIVILVLGFFGAVIKAAGTF